MHALIQFPGVGLLAIFVGMGDIAIKAAVARDTIRALCYGIVAILALIALILILLGAQ